MNEDPQYFLDEVYTILFTMRVTSNEKVEQSTYQLKDLSQIWYTQWMKNRALRAGPIRWEILGRLFLIKFSQGSKERKKLKNLSTFV